MSAQNMLIERLGLCQPKRLRSLYPFQIAAQGPLLALLVDSPEDQELAFVDLLIRGNDMTVQVMSSLPLLQSWQSPVSSKPVSRNYTASSNLSSP